MSNNQGTHLPAWDIQGQLWLTEGTKAWESGEREQALELFNRIIETYPERPEGYNKAGVVYAETKQLDKAEKYFLYALSKDRMHVPALTNLGNIYLERGEIENAVQHYTLALQGDAEYPPAHRNLAIALRRQGRIGASVSHLKRSQRLESRKMQDRLRAEKSVVKGSAPQSPDKLQAMNLSRRWLWIIPVAIIVIWVLARGKL